MQSYVTKCHTVFRPAVPFLRSTPGPVLLNRRAGLFRFMAISCWGYVPEDLEIVFEPVMTTSPAERAELVQKLCSDVIEAFKCGLLTREQALEELKARGEELGVYTKV